MTIFLDLETSGLSPEQGAAILSIGLVADNGSLDTLTGELEVHVIPTEEQWAAASPQALEVNGLTLEFLQANGVPLNTAIYKVCAWLADQRVWLGTEIVGQNPDFDYRFLRFFMKDELACTGFPVDRNATNVIDLAKELTTKDKNFRLPPTAGGRPSFKGSNISMALGLPPEPAIHTALAGARACRQNFYGLHERLSKARRTITFR
jgi:DNA polymerase III epsilon subunit-like protein